MSRYLLLLLLNLPFVIAGLLSAITQYKLGKSSKARLTFQVGLWLLILVGLISAEAIYTFLFSNNLTQSEPLSLFDVVQVTAIVSLAYIANRSRTKIESLERRVNDLHQELSIRLSSDELVPAKNNTRK